MLDSIWQSRQHGQQAPASVMQETAVLVLYDGHTYCYSDLTTTKEVKQAWEADPSMPADITWHEQDCGHYVELQPE